MTRHNVGFWCVDHLAEEWSISMSERRRHAAIGEGEVEGVPVALAKPRTYVNKSGAAVTSLMARYRATAEDLLVIYDDMDLAAGKLRLRATGSAGGHNGMRSIVGALGTQDFVRLRIGIGRPRPGVDEIDYVLGRMARSERDKVNEAVERGAQAIAVVFTEGIDEAMNRFN